MVDLYGTAVGRAKGVVALVVLALAAAVLVAAPASASHYTNTTELAATTNAGAAVALSKATFATNAAEVILGRDDVFADSLASGSLQNGRPLLLTNSQTLTPETQAEIDRLKPTYVNILGGTSAVSAGIENDLKNRGYQIRRFSGPTRLETAIDVARRNYQTATSAIIASAFAPQNSPDPTRAFADSIAAGAWAAASSLPVLLTETDHLSTSTRNYLRGSLIRSVFVVGGAGAVSETTVAELQQIGITVKRVAGATRFDTAIAIARERGFADAAKATEVILTEGQAAHAWAAGFASAAYAKAKNAPVVLSNGTMLPDPTRAYLAPPGGAAATKLLCAPRSESAPCDAASAAMGHTAISGSIPRLTSVTTAASATPGASEVHYKFSEPVTTVVAERFKLYAYDAITIPATAAVRDPARPDVVVATFPSASFADATVAAVAYDAVRSTTNGVQSMEGSAAIQGVTRSASRGPNLVSIDLEEDDSSATKWEIFFIFDKDVDECGDATDYRAVRKTPSQSNVQVLTAAGVDEVDGDAKSCEAEFTGTGLTNSDLARGFVLPGAVETTGLNGVKYANTGTSADLAATPGPDLTTFTVNAAQSQVTFEFDQDVDAVTPQSTSERHFRVYDTRGNVYEATSAVLSSEASTTVPTKKVVATFQDGSMLRNGIVHATVNAGAVKGRLDPLTQAQGYFNGPDEVRKAITFASGTTIGPVLTAVNRGNSPGNTGTRITFTFADAVDETTAGTPGSFAVYGDDGTRTVLTAGECTVDPSDQKKVHCDVAANATHINAVRAAVFGAVTRDAVRADGQAAATGPSAPNPEAYKQIA